MLTAITAAPATPAQLPRARVIVARADSEGAASLPGYVCPRCRAPVQREGQGDGEAADAADAWTCVPCTARYPIVLGIPDFRVAPDPWIGLEADRDKARRVAAASDGGDLAAAVAAYWAITPGTPPALAQRHADHVLSGERRAAEWLDAQPHDAAPHDAAPHDATARGAWLDVGCGSGDLLAEGARRGIPMVGADVAMRWLVLARRRVALRDGAQRLVCCNGERLPFADGVMRRVSVIGTLEHCASAATLLTEASRVLQRDGRVAVRTVNRYTLLAEPHVHVWGVGFVPRRWADAYVRWRSGQRYLHHQPLSRRELARALRTAGFTDTRTGPAALLPSERARLARRARWVADAYAGARATPVLRDALALVAPALDASGTVR